MWIFLFDTINIFEKLEKKKKRRISLNPDIILPQVYVHRSL